MIRIPSFPNYMAMESGEIFSLSTGKILLGDAKGRNYRRVSLLLNGKTYNKEVHVLVCEAYHGMNRECVIVTHIDGNYSNNRPDNLKWGR